MTAPRLVATDLDGTLLRSDGTFGDMPNDLPMLRWAGCSYAVGESHPSVVRAATHRAGSNDDDGVARVLEALVCEI